MLHRCTIPRYHHSVCSQLNMPYNQAPSHDAGTLLNLFAWWPVSTSTSTPNLGDAKHFTRLSTSRSMSANFVLRQTHHNIACPISNMADKASRDNALEDSTDWLGTPLATLHGVEGALRCQVCKEFYKTPMITSCAHTFCSICIRHCLQADGKCPACRAAQQELHLRNNYTVEELVEAFQAARSSALEFARTASQTTIQASPKRKRSISSQDTVEGVRHSKRTRSSSRRLVAQAQTTHEPIIVDENVEDEDFQPGQHTWSSCLLYPTNVCHNRRRTRCVSCMW